MPWQPVPVLFPDAELVFTAGLRGLLAQAGDTDVFVSNKVPTTRRARMVIVNRDGGAADGATDHPRIRVRCWASTAQTATDLARDVVAHMQSLVNGSPVTRVNHLSGPYEVPDSSGQEQRYLLFEAVTKGTDS